MPGPSTTDDATLTNVTASASAVDLFAAAGGVSLRIVVNDSTATLYLKYGAGASATSYTARLDPSGQYEFPPPVYTGQVTGIWTAANGAARCTEVA